MTDVEPYDRSVPDTPTLQEDVKKTQTPPFQEGFGGLPAGAEVLPALAVARPAEHIAAGGGLERKLGDISAAIRALESEGRHIHHLARCKAAIR